MSLRPQLSVIAAVARNGVIGKGNALPWRLPDDQQHFKRTTLGHPVIMGRRTWDSLPARFRPLPGRRNIVVTRNLDWRADGAEAASSLDGALLSLQREPKVFVIGGADLYALALPLADELVLTEIEHDFDGDARFPTWRRDDFDEVERLSRVSAAGWPYHFATYRRKRAEN